MSPNTTLSIDTHNQRILPDLPESTWERRERLSRTLVFVIAATANDQGITGFRQVIDRVAELEGINGQAGRTLLRRCLQDLADQRVIELQRDRAGGQAKRILWDPRGTGRGADVGFTRYVREIMETYGLTPLAISRRIRMSEKTVQRWRDGYTLIPRRHRAKLVKFFAEQPVPDQVRHRVNVLSEGIPGLSRQKSKIARVYGGRSVGTHRWLLCIVETFEWLPDLEDCRLAGLSPQETATAILRLHPDTMCRLEATEDDLVAVVTFNASVRESSPQSKLFITRGSHGGPSISGRKRRRMGAHARDYPDLYRRAINLCEGVCNGEGDHRGASS